MGEQQGCLVRKSAKGSAGRKARRTRVRRADHVSVPIPERTRGLGGQLVLGDVDDAGGTLVDLDLSVLAVHVRFDGTWRTEWLVSHQCQGKRRATLRETAGGEPHLGESEEEEKEEEEAEEETVMIVSCRSSGMLGRWALTSPTAQPPSRGTLDESSAASSAATFRANMFRAALEAE
jgi:hypothetical protein